MTIYRATPSDDSDVFYFRADFRHSSCGISLSYDDEITADTEWQSTQYQVADSRHDPEQAAKLLAESAGYTVYYRGRLVGEGRTEAEAIEEAIDWYGEPDDDDPSVEEFREALDIESADLEVEPLEWKCACEHCAETAEDPAAFRESDDGKLYCAACVEYTTDADGEIICAKHGTGSGCWPIGDERDVCPVCGFDLCWWDVQDAVAPGKPSYMEGECECSTWRQEERNGKGAMPIRTPRDAKYR